MSSTPEREKHRDDSKKLALIAISVLTAAFLLSTVIGIISASTQRRRESIESDKATIGELIEDGDYGKALEYIANCEDTQDRPFLETYALYAKAGQAINDGNYESGIAYVLDAGGSISVAYAPMGGSVDPASVYVDQGNPFPGLPTPERFSYTFSNWGSSRFDIDISSSRATLELYAIWEIDLDITPAKSEDASKGSVEVYGRTNASGNIDTIVEAIPKDNYYFLGWYLNNAKVCPDPIFTLDGPIDDGFLVAKFADLNTWGLEYGLTPSFNEDKSMVTYGLYPQTHASGNAALANKLDRLTEPGPNGWYLYNGVYYAKVVAHPDGYYPFSDRITISDGIDYWFRCEPIKWRVLSSGETYYVLSDVILDARRFDDDSSDYRYSEMRSYLNNDFLSSAFCFGSSFIKKMVVENAPLSSTGYSDNRHYSYKDTVDFVAILSQSEATNEEYGFTSKTTASNTRVSKATDYALANGAYMFNNASWWWLRSEGYNSAEAESVDPMGTFSSKKVDLKAGGIRPAITIKL